MNRNPQIAFERGYYVAPDGRVSNPSGKPLSCYVTRKGYRKFHFQRGAALQVSRLVAFQKFGEAIFGNGIVVRHLDGNSKNDSWENIAIGTHSQNMMDMPPEVRRAKAAAANRKFDPAKVRAFYQQSGSYKVTMAEFGITSKGTLHHILNKATEIPRVAAQEAA